MSHNLFNALQEFKMASGKTGKFYSLPALLEERARLVSQLERQGCSADALWANDGGFNAA